MIHRDTSFPFNPQSNFSCSIFNNTTEYPRIDDFILHLYCRIQAPSRSIHLYWEILSICKLQWYNPGNIIELLGSNVPTPGQLMINYCLRSECIASVMPYFRLAPKSPKLMDSICQWWSGDHVSDNNLDQKHNTRGHVVIIENSSCDNTNPEPSTASHYSISI